MRSNYTYAQFEEEVKASQKKNGVETSKNAQGYKVETTYVDGVVTKVVEYKYNGKSVAKETEYFANGQVKQEIKYVSYNNDKESVTEYYENGQVKHVLRLHENSIAMVIQQVMKHIHLLMEKKDISL